MSDRMKYPPNRDFGFYQRRKHDKWREVAPPQPALERPVADSHAHIHMLPDPAWELARCAANNVRFACEICDPSEDDIKSGFLSSTRMVIENAREAEFAGEDSGRGNGGNDGKNGADGEPFKKGEAAKAIDEASGEAGGEKPCEVRTPQKMTKTLNDKKHDFMSYCVAAGVHPHNAKLYDEEVEQRLRTWLAAPAVKAVGEIGLDFHYDLSPRDAQRRVFRRQIELACELDLPIALHLRGGEDSVEDNAHAEAFAILSEMGFPARGTIVHCCALPPDELRPWIEAGCYIAYGGALTFKNADAARAGALIVPEDRLLLETDSPYMAPEPMRGTVCTPAHVIFTAAALAELRGCMPGPDRGRFLSQLWENTLRFFGME